MDGLSNATKSSETDTFQSRFCARYHCRQADFERRVLWKCVYPLARPMAWVLWLLRYGYFEGDLDLIEDVKGATTYASARMIVMCSDGPANPNWLRRYLRVRMSRGKLLELARTLLDRQTPSPAAAASNVSLAVEKNLS